MQFRVRPTPAYGVDTWLGKIRRGGGTIIRWEMRGEVLMVYLRTHNRTRLRAALGGKSGLTFSLLRVNH